MVIGIPKEIINGENRIGVTPNTVKDLIKNNFQIIIESNAGLGSFINNKDYESAGAKIINITKELYDSSDMIVKVNPPTSSEEIDLLKNGSAILSFMQPTKELQLVESLNNKNISGFSLHLIPRTTLAQKMDALSSQTNIAGYRSVLMGAMHIKKYMPLLMTAAGTIQPAKVLIIGAGVAGLQAIATAKRLGAQVEAFDVRPIVKEQVESLGAKFIEVKSDDDGVGEGGYAKETSEEYKKKQSELMALHLSKADIIITTALIPGRPAPKLITDEMVNSMKPGSAIIDLASENGGNCTLTTPDKIINHNNIIIDGTSNIPSEMSIDATQVLSKNILSFLLHVFPDGKNNLNLDDEITADSLYCYNGEITHQMTKDTLKGEG